MKGANRLEGHEPRDTGLFGGGEIRASLPQIADYSAIRDGRSGFGRGIPHLARSSSVVTEIEVQIARWIYGAGRNARNI